MSALSSRLPWLAAIFFGGFAVSMLARSYSDTSAALIASSVFMFGCCWASAAHLMGGRAAARFVGISVTLGWFAEEMGARYGWFFGDYTYTEVLGPRISEVPCVIPMMWFALCYTGYVFANLIATRRAVDVTPGLRHALLLSLLAAMVVTAFDLGGDPYLVYKLKAWIMLKKDGAWFGETVQGFFGWMFVSFSILLLFRRFGQAVPRPEPQGNKLHALVPLGVYAGTMVFQIAFGYPVETRTIAVFAMGIPLLSALIAWRQWVPAGAAQ